MTTTQSSTLTTIGTENGGKSMPPLLDTQLLDLLRAFVREEVQRQRVELRLALLVRDLRRCEC